MSERNSFSWGVVVVGGVVISVIFFFAGRLSVRVAVLEAALRTATVGTPSPEAIKTPDTAPVISPPKGIKETLSDASPSPGWDEKQWNDLKSQPGNPARNAALAAMLEKLAATDSTQAMALAHTEGNLKLREELVQASLHGWARTSLTNAAGWALALPDANERERALATVFAGAVATDPEAAVRLGKSLIQQNPDEALGYGARLIDTLCDAGHFETAAHMAADGGAELRAGWMANSYCKWAEFQPEKAASAAAAIKDPALRDEALHGIVGGWAEADPVGLMKFVIQLPADAGKSSIVSQSLENWVKHDPEGASAWMNQNENRPELDEGAAVVATMESIKPDVAVGWAESITSPALRSETLVMVVRNWMSVDIPAARLFYETTKSLTDEDRQQLKEVFAGMDNPQ